MAADVRRPFEGVLNIIRFNWPFYALAAAVLLVLLLVAISMAPPISTAAFAVMILTIIATSVSLAVSAYVYDLSGFYELKWLDGLSTTRGGTMININAGFDETSAVLREKFQDAELVVWDFYDPAKHTEASIRRARTAYPPYPGTLQMSVDVIRAADAAAENVFAIMSAHEIRNAAERDLFFTEIERCLTPDGTVVVVEHVRDAANLLAYNIGAFHFQTRKAWLASFEASKLSVQHELKINPFVTAFFLKKNGTAS